jgi:hypothetical protein
MALAVALEIIIERDSRWTASRTHDFKEVLMLWTISGILLLLWLLGLVGSYTMGGFIHILLVVAVITVLVRIIRGR